MRAQFERALRDTVAHSDMSATSASASASARSPSPLVSASTSPFRRLLSLVSTVTLSLLLLCLQPAAVSASHFAYGTLSWEHAPTPASPNFYLVNFEVAFRRSYGWTPRNPSAGTYFSSSDVGTIVVSQTQNAGPCCGLPTSVTQRQHDDCTEQRVGVG